jgi:hypothetical protein
VAQGPPVVGVEGLVKGEVTGVVDRGLDPEGPALLQVGLRLGGLVVDLQLGGDVRGDDLGGETPGRLVAPFVDDLAVDDDRYPLGASEIEMR